MVKSFEEILGDLASPHLWVRTAAVEALGAYPSGKTADLLLAVLDGEKDRRSWPLGPPEMPVLLAAVRALGAVGERRAAEPLCSLLEWDAPELVRSAALALATIGDPRAVRPLIGILTRGDRRERSAAAYALGKLGDSTAVPVLVRALGDPSPGVMAAAVGALADLGEGDLARAVDAALAGSPGAAAELGDERAMVPLLWALAHPDRERWQRIGQAFALLPAPGGDALAEAVGEAGEEERHTMAEGIATLGARVAGTLVDALTHPSWPARCVAVEALGFLGAAAAAARGPLRRLAARPDLPPSDDLRWLCWGALWRIAYQLQQAPAELEASEAPAGTGTEPEAAGAPRGRGTEPESAMP